MGANSVFDPKDALWVCSVCRSMNDTAAEMEQCWASHGWKGPLSGKALEDHMTEFVADLRLVLESNLPPAIWSVDADGNTCITQYLTTQTPSQ